MTNAKTIPREDLGELTRELDALQGGMDIAAILNDISSADSVLDQLESKADALNARIDALLAEAGYKDETRPAAAGLAENATAASPPEISLSGPDTADYDARGAAAV